MSDSGLTLPYSKEALEYLLSPRAIRERSRRILEAAESGQTHFEVHRDKLREAASLVAEVTRRSYPELDIPFHSRWRHFKAGGIDREAILDAGLMSASREERARAKLDLAIVSVLLDAGAGAQWKYREPGTEREFSRSEGLGVASFRMFLNGAFSSDPARPLRADAEGLKALTEEKLARGFQVSPSNLLVGLAGRVGLLHELARAVARDTERFAGPGPARPGNLLGYYDRRALRGSIAAEELLLGVLLGLGPIWPGRARMGEVNLGDVWPHPALGPQESADGWVPFHKLSQWLTYSLMEPLQEYGLEIRDLDGLTGLAEYRNGGLLLDSGVLSLRDPSLSSQPHRPDSRLVIEWRALTIALLDPLADLVRGKLGKTEKEFPLAKVLEGGTWQAGREIASRLRPGGPPPLPVESDGTVF